MTCSGGQTCEVFNGQGIRVSLRILQQVPGQELVVDVARLDVVEVTPKAALSGKERQKVNFGDFQLKTTTSGVHSAIFTGRAECLRRILSIRHNSTGASHHPIHFCFSKVPSHHPIHLFFQGPSPISLSILVPSRTRAVSSSRPRW